MATIVTRSGKGSPLTNAEVDGNFTNLNTELGTKANASSLATVATSGAYSDLTGKPTNVSSFANDSGYITGITSGNVTTALGFTPYNATNPAGYITGITSGNVTTALGYTPANRAGDNFTGAVGFLGGSAVASNGDFYARRDSGSTGVYYFAAGVDKYLYWDGSSYNFGGAGPVIAPTSFRAPIFYDSNNTGYYVDPNGTSNIGGLTVTNTITGSVSGNAATATNISNTGTVTLASATESNSIYATAPSYTADQPTKLLNFDWYSNVFSIGNIRSGSTPSSGFGFYYTPSGGSRSELMRLDPSGSVLINRTSASGIGKLNVEGGADVTSGNVTVQAGYGIAWRGDQSRIMTPDDNSYGALIRWGATGGCRLFESTTERLRIDGTGSVRAFVDFRAPIFYDSNDTGRYLDPSSTSVLTTVEAYNGSGFRSYSTPSSGINSQIYFANAANTRAWNWQLDENNNAALWGFNGTTWAKRIGVTNSSELYLRNTSGTDILAAYPSTFGYSSGYRTLVLGNQAYTTVCIGVDPVANASGSFNGAGSGVEVMFKNGAYFISPNSANNSYNNYLQLVDGIVVVTNYLQATSSLRAPLFYDSDNTSYFVDPTSTSRLSVANVNFMTLLNDEGLNVKGIRGQFAAGSDGQGISLFSNVDIGYPSGWGSGLGNTPSRGLSVYGGLRVAYSGDGFITSDTSVRSPIFYDSNNTGYYVDPASTSIQYRINVLNGINLTGGIALTSSGATLDNSIAMRLTENYGALWNGGDGTLWHHQVINASMLCGFTGAGANWGSGRVVASNDVRGTLFYDYNNTAYYVDPNSTSVLNNLSVNGGAVYRSDWTTRFQSPSDFVDGTLVTTDIPATGFAGDSFVIEITGKTYDQNNPPVKVVAQGYLYNDTIINYSGISYAGNFASYVKVFQDGGVLKFWWPRISYWNSFNVNVMSMDGQTNGTITRNRVTAIGNSTEPTGTKKVQINLTKTLKTGDAAGSISGFNNPTTAPTANTIAYRDAAGDISAREIVLSSGLSTATPTVLVSMFPTTNQMVRTTPAAVAASIQSSIQTLGNFNVVTGATECGIRFRGAALDFVGRFSDYMSVYNQTSGGEIKLFNSGFFNCNQYGVNEASWRAPIFYDSNDTNYYLDPASTSRINQINYTALYSASSSDYGIVGNNGYFDTVNSGVDADALELCYVRGSEVRIGTGGGNKAIRASIFYEGTDTAYYLDPNGGTSLRTVGDWRSDSGAWTGEFNGKIQYHANNWYFQSANTWEFRRSDSANAFSVSQAGAAEARNDFRAPIFYDNYNTGYYVDPNSTSNLVGLTVGNRINGSISGDAQRLFNHTGTNNDGLQYWNTTNNATLNPNTGWHYAIRMGHGDADTYYSATIAVDFFSDNVWLRRKGGGTDQPWKRFALYDNAYAAPFYANVYYDADNSTYYLDPSTNGTSLNVAGAIVAGGNITAYSDIRIKANVETIPSALDKLDQIRGVTYTRTDLEDKEQRYAGVIAQEIEAVLPEAVRDLGDIKAVDYNATIALLIQAVKELRDEVEMLRK